MRNSFLMGLRVAVLLGSLFLFTWAAVGGQGLSFVVAWLDGLGLASLGDAFSPAVAAEASSPADGKKKGLAAAGAGYDPNKPALWMDGPPPPQPEPISVVDPNAPVLLTPRDEAVSPPAASPWSSSFSMPTSMAPPTSIPDATAMAAPLSQPGFAPSQPVPPLGHPAGGFAASPATPAMTSPAPPFGAGANGPSTPVVTPVGYFPDSPQLTPLTRAASSPTAQVAGGVEPAAETGDENARLQALSDELQTLGASFYRLEQVGDASLYRCQCRVPLAGRPQLSRHFQATGPDQATAMHRVVELVREARTVRQ